MTACRWRAFDRCQSPGKTCRQIIVHRTCGLCWLTMKPSTGNRALTYFTAQMLDVAHLSTTPVRVGGRKTCGVPHADLQGVHTDTGLEVTQHGMQVFGGHGFIRDGAWRTGADCGLRDLRGTNGNQALDPLGRKVLGSQASCCAASPKSSHVLRSECGPCAIGQLRRATRRAQSTWGDLTMKAAWRP